MSTHFDTMHERDRQTDRQTHTDGYFDTMHERDRQTDRQTHTDGSWMDTA